MIWVGICGVAATIFINLAVLFHWGGKLEQKLSDNKETTNATLSRHEGNINELYNLSRVHDQSDQVHFKDGDKHWAPQERGWLNTRFIEMGERFDKLERILEKRDR